MQLIISHRPRWAEVPGEKLKIDFASALLEQLWEQTAGPQKAEQCEQSAGPESSREELRAIQHQVAE